VTSQPPFFLSPEELESDIRAFRKARLTRLTAARGWLTLIGKVWLAEGTHRIGSAPESHIVLPRERSPAHLGTLTVAAGNVQLDVDPAAVVHARGERVTSLVLRSESDEAPDEVRIGSLTLSLLRRGSDVALRIRDAESAARLSFPGIPTYPVDPAWRIVARLEPFASPREILVADGDGRSQSYLSSGLARFEKDGISSALLPLVEEREKRLFVLFSDATSKDETYGAGRFLYAPAPQDGQVLLDFNKAFNPPCAFTPYAVCPLPPAENRLLQRVNAGEKRPHSLASMG